MATDLPRDVGRGGVGVGSELGKADPLGEGCGGVQREGNSFCPLRPVPGCPLPRSLIIRPDASWSPGSGRPGLHRPPFCSGRGERGCLSHGFPCGPVSREPPAYPGGASVWDAGVRLLGQPPVLSHILPSPRCQLCSPGLRSSSPHGRREALPLQRHLRPFHNEDSGG